MSKTPKIVQLVSSCGGGCPHYRYYSGGVHECGQVGLAVVNSQEVAPFCPLPDFPSVVIAGLEATVMRLAHPNDNTLAIAVMSHISAKLGCTFHYDGVSIFIPLKKEGPLSLFYESITKIETGLGAGVHFISGEDRGGYTLYPDANPPILRRELKETGPNGETFYQDVEMDLPFRKKP